MQTSFQDIVYHKIKHWVNKWNPWNSEKSAFWGKKKQNIFLLILWSDQYGAIDILVAVDIAYMLS